MVPILNTARFDHITIFVLVVLVPILNTAHFDHITVLVLVVLVPILNTARFDEIKTKSNVILKIMTFAFCCAEQLMAIKESYDLSYSDLWFCLTLDTVTCVLFDLRHCDLYPV